MSPGHASPTVPLFALSGSPGFDATKNAMTTDSIRRKASALSRARTALAAAAVLAGGMAQASVEASDSRLAERLELRGYTQIGDSHAFSVHDKETGESEWVWADEPSENFHVEDFDRENHTVTLRYRNEVATISLQRSRIAQYDRPVTPRLPTFEPPTPPPGQSGRSNAGRERPTDSGASPRPGDRSGGGDPSSGGNDETGNDFSGGFIPGGNAGTLPPDNPGGSPPSSSPGENDSDDSDDSSIDAIGPPPPDPATPPPDYTPDT